MTRTVMRRRGAFAGPCSTLPVAASNWAPWQGHWKVVPAYLTGQPSWVHDASKATNWPAAGCTTNPGSPVSGSVNAAAPPTGTAEVGPSVVMPAGAGAGCVDGGVAVDGGAVGEDDAEVGADEGEEGEDDAEVGEDDAEVGEDDAEVGDDEGAAVDGEVAGVRVVEVEVRFEGATRPTRAAKPAPTTAAAPTHPATLTLCRKARRSTSATAAGAADSASAGHPSGVQRWSRRAVHRPSR